MKKTQPLRQCVGCGEMKPKTELIRIVKTPDGKIMLDRSGKANGRGAYICHNDECYKKAVKAKRLERAFSLANMSTMLNCSGCAPPIFGHSASCKLVQI